MGGADVGDRDPARVGVGAGDEARAIHWRRTAALGQMVVRERQRDAARRVTLLIDEARPDGADEAWSERFEAMLSRVATAASKALARGASVSAEARSGRSPVVLPGQPPDPLWRFLALLSPTVAGDRIDSSDRDARRFEVSAG